MLNHCEFTRGFDPLFFLLVMLLKTHLSELAFRSGYIIMSLLIIYIIILLNNDLVLLIFSPNLKTFMVYSNIIDSIILKWTFSFYLSLFFLTPFLLFSFWAFIRPGLFKFEDIKVGFWPLIIILPLLIYFSIIWFYNNYILVFSVSTNDLNLLGRFLPTLLQIILINKKIMIFSWLLIFLLFLPNIIDGIFLKWTFSFYKKYRFYFLFIILLFITQFLPPDVLLLLISAIFIFIIAELCLFCHLWARFYYIVLN